MLFMPVMMLLTLPPRHTMVCKLHCDPLSTCLQAAAPAAQAADDYSRLLSLTMQFYQAQMSGQLPAWNSISWRKSAHLQDGADAQLDLAGGFYDAGGEGSAALVL
jgi:hypothetical protein